MGDASYIEATEDRSECIYRREDHFQEERDAAVRDVKKAREQIVAQKRRIQELEEELSREQVRSTMPVAAHLRATPYSRPTGVSTMRQRVGLARITRETPLASYAEAAAASAAPRPVAPGPSESNTGPSSSSASRPPRRMTGDIGLLDDMSSDDSGGDIEEDDDIDGAIVDQPIIRASAFGRDWRNAMKSLTKNGRAINETVVNEYHLLKPSSRAELLFLEELMNEYQSEPLTQFMGRFKAKAQARARTKRTPAMHHILKHWQRPAWMKVASGNEDHPPAPINYG